jgi:hypothetical protein
LTVQADKGREILWRSGAGGCETIPRVRGGRALRTTGAALVSVVALAVCGPAVAAGDVPAVTISDTPTGQVVQPGFIGVSVEFPAVHQYTGRNPNAVNPVLLGLLRNLSPGAPPQIRIGGNSTDRSWWPIPGVLPPAGITYRITNGWLRTTRALAADLGAKLVLGVNLAAGRPALAVAEEQAYLRGIGRQYIQSIEIGNEPDLYSTQAWYKGPDGQVLFPRSRTYGVDGFMHDFERWRSALGPVPLTGPALAELAWGQRLDAFINGEPRVNEITMHRYPLRGCVTDKSSPIYASIPNLLGDASSFGLAQNVAPFVQIAHAHGLPFRLDELNSVSCAGRFSVSNTFAAALWALDTLFNLANVGVDGIDFHTLPHAGYELATYHHSGGTWSAFVHPEYYAALMFGQAAPPGSELLSVSAPAGPLKVWATQTPAGAIHVVLINKSTTDTQTIQLALPRTDAPTIEWLQAPSAYATSGVTLGRVTFGTSTTTGELPSPPAQDQLSRVSGSLTVTMPPASAAMLTQ